MKDKIKAALKKKGMSQKELAEVIGISEVGLSKSINGTMSRNTLIKIADALDIQLSDLEPKMLKAKYGSDKTPLRLGELELPCYVLEDGTRVFSGRGIQKVLGTSSTSGLWLSRFVETPGIKLELQEIKTGESDAYNKITKPIKFLRNNAGGSQSETYGYEATLLIDLCDAIIKTGELGLIEDDSILKNANIIIRAVAKTGIIALIDEATGYDKAKTRAKDELQKFLNSFLSQEAAKWVKVFPDVFFEDLYKMHNWNWTQTSKRPGVVGQWINDIVYSRIAPLILKELDIRNPKNGRGNRLYKHHQLLSRDVGLPKLQQHLETIHAIVVISDYKWPLFMRNLNKAYPQQYQQLEIDFDFDEQ